MKLAHDCVQRDIPSPAISLQHVAILQSDPGCLADI